VTERLEVGRIAKAHGLRGEVVVVLSTDRLERVAPGSVLHDGERDLVVVASRPHQERHIVEFEGVHGREAADALRGRTLHAEPLDADDVLWIHELIGRRVVELDGTERGVVESVQSNPASDLLVLDTGALVPLAFVVEDPGVGAPGPSGDADPSDATLDTVVIDPPEGLFDL
jgi:16S rRNA processing protein RimM